MKSEINSFIGFDSRNGRFQIDDNNPEGMMRPGAYCQIVARPQRAFRGSRLFVWSRTAPSFLIHEIRVGHRYMGVSAEAPIPAEMFATHLDQLAELDARMLAGEPIAITIKKSGIDCLGLPLAMPLLMPGMEAFISVECVGDRPARFIAGIYGITEDSDTLRAW
jgi:hypothetical protein